jgi:hypothetical protein
MFSEFWLSKIVIKWIYQGHWTGLIICEIKPSDFISFIMTPYCSKLHNPVDTLAAVHKCITSTWNLDTYCTKV